jgi:hypothetical protein
MVSTGKVLTRVFELRDLTWVLLRGKGSVLLNRFIDPNFPISSAYLADVF